MQVYSIDAADRAARRDGLPDDPSQVPSVSSEARADGGALEVTVSGAMYPREVFDVARYLHASLDHGADQIVLDLSAARLLGHGPFVLALSKVSRRARRRGGGLVIVTGHREDRALLTSDPTLTVVAHAAAAEAALGLCAHPGPRGA